MAAGAPFRTPIGEIPRTTAYAIGGGIVVIGGVVWYRGRKAATDAASATSGDIDPATGFPYGSAEDIAALGQQGYANPSAGTGGPASPTYPYNPVPAGPGVFTNNAEWAQAAIEYLTGNGDVADAGKLTAALGKYLAGSPVPDTGDQSLIEQAIAVEGKPPVAGLNGYPPAINTSHPVPAPTPVPTPKPAPAPKMTAPTGIHIAGTHATAIDVDWTPLPGAIGYQILVNGRQNGNTVLYSAGSARYLRPATSYRIGVRGVYPGNHIGPTATISARTSK